MAIGSVKELVDYERETIKIAKKHGGGSVDLGLIADNYDPNRTEQYPSNDMVVYNGKLYKSLYPIKPTSGEFDPTMWDEVADYDPTHTYNEFDYAVHEGNVYRCDEASTTGEWDSSKWTEVGNEFPEYDETTTYYYPSSSKCKEGDDYYISNATYEPTGGVGDFDSTKWSETTVEACLPKSLTHTLCSASAIRTDANGYVTNTLSYPSGTYTPVEYRYTTSMPMMGATCMVQVEHGCISGNNQTRLRLVDASGSPLASITEGISDMGSLILKYLTI